MWKQEKGILSVNTKVMTTSSVNTSLIKLVINPIMNTKLILIKWMILESWRGTWINTWDVS